MSVRPFCLELSRHIWALTPDIDCDRREKRIDILRSNVKRAVIELPRLMTQIDKLKTTIHVDEANKTIWGHVTDVRIDDLKMLRDHLSSLDCTTGYIRTVNVMPGYDVRKFRYECPVTEDKIEAILMWIIAP